MPLEVRPDYQQLRMKLGTSAQERIRQVGAAGEFVKRALQSHHRASQQHDLGAMRPVCGIR